MARQPYFPFFTADWIQDTRMLSLEARAIWIDLLTLMHQSDRRGHLTRDGNPLSPEQIARFAGCSPEVASRAVQELITSGVASCTDTGVIFCRRMVREEKKRDLCSRAGKKGGGNPDLQGRGVTYKGHYKGRAKVPPKVPPNSPIDIECISSLEFSSSEEEENSVAQTECAPGVGVQGEGTKNGCPKGAPKGAPKGQSDCERDEWFERFWESYPRKTAKQDALRAWRKLRADDALLTVILAALQRQKLSRQWQENVIPHPATWLNGRRWEDELPVSATTCGETIKDQLARIREKEKCKTRNGTPGSNGT